LSGRGLCDELITRPEESCRMCCVVVCDLETSRMVAPYIYDVSHLRVKCYVSCNVQNLGNKILYIKCYNIPNTLWTTWGARGGAVSWGCSLQTGNCRFRFSVVSLEFFIDIILPAALWPWGSTQPLTEMSIRNISWGKDGRCVGLTTLPP
jgi:hypothetical protein